MDFLEFDNCGFDVECDEQERAEFFANEFHNINNVMGGEEGIDKYDVFPTDEDDDNKLHIDEISSETLQLLCELYEPLNEEFYELLESNPGPLMEQNPFPKFGSCD